MLGYLWCRSKFPILINQGRFSFWQSVIRFSWVAAISIISAGKYRKPINLLAASSGIDDGMRMAHTKLVYWWWDKFYNPAQVLLLYQRINKNISFREVACNEMRSHVINISRKAAVAHLQAMKVKMRNKRISMGTLIIYKSSSWRWLIKPKLLAGADKESI